MKRKEFLSNQPDPNYEIDRNSEFQDNDNTIWKGKGIDAIIYESVKILKEKGYDEKGLSNGEPEGMFKTHLKTQLQELLDSDENLVGIYQFYVKNVGFYNNGDDIVRFTFSYDYNPELQEIALTGIEAELNEVPLNQDISVLSDIWTSKDMYERLKELRSMVQNHNIVSQNEKLQKLFQRESTHLHHLGFEQNGQLGRKLKAEMVKSVDKGKKTDHFSIKARRFCSLGEMKLSLYYQFIPEIDLLKVKSIIAELNNQKVAYSNDGTSPIPSLEDLKFFYSKHKNDLANKLADHSPDSYLKNRLK